MIDKIMFTAMLFLVIEIVFMKIVDSEKAKMPIIVSVVILFYTTFLVFIISVLIKIWA